ncbi:MAG: prolyl oligopeptidase family serine peptidase, partial [Gemmatimonadetes bacterium]|nr:prolyl oligopeptidase family serine peptidase [Gemmatimonadota bacterium]
MHRSAALSPLLISALLLAAPAPPAAAQAPFSIQEVLSPAFPHTLVSARDADRVAWIEYREGRRNVWTAAAPGFEPVRLTEHLHDDGVDLTDLQISDDGSVVVWMRGHDPNRQGWVANPTSDAEGGMRSVWAASTRDGRTWEVAGAWDAVLSPDGRWIAWDQDGQIHRAAVDPGATSRPTREDARPLVRAWGENEEPVWSPDSRRIAFESDREDHAFVGVYDTGARTVTWLAAGVDRDSDPVWSPDGRRVAFLRRPGDPFGERAERDRELPDSAYPEGLLDARFAGGHTLEMWVADAATGEGRRVWHGEPGDSIWAEVRELHWAGDRLVFMAEADGWRHYYAVDASPSGDGGWIPPELLTPGEGIVEHIAFSPDGRWLYYATNVDDIDRRHLWRVPVDGGRPEQLTRGETVETYPAVLASGERVAVLHASWRRPLSVAMVAAGGGGPEVISRPLPAAFPTARHVEPENVVITAEDGFETHNQVFLPPDLEPGERRPALIFIHGGSRRQMLLGYHYMHFYHMAYAMNQYFANRGYVVLSSNYRSGIGYGRDFREAPGRGGRGNTEYLDIRAAGRYLAERADVDPERVGLWGRSYGGILTAQGLARDSDLFAAGVDIAGVHLWGDSIDPESTSYRASSISEIENWTSPVLLIHGDDDRNVEFSQTVGLVQLLRAHGVPHELIVYPDEVHDFLVHDR